MTRAQHYACRVILAIVLCLAWLLLRERACAQDLEHRAHILAQLAVNEASWHVEDVAPLHRAIGNWARQRGISWERQALRHSDRVYDRVRTDCRRWVAFLRPDLGKPRHWPRYRRCDPKRGKHPPWRNFRGRWGLVLAEARKVVRDNPNPCNGEPFTWGSDADLRRYMRLHPDAVVLECGDTINHYLRPKGE